jgi:hypothetical protein
MAQCKLRSGSSREGPHCVKKKANNKNKEQQKRRNKKIDDGKWAQKKSQKLCQKKIDDDLQTLPNGMEWHTCKKEKKTPISATNQS